MQQESTNKNHLFQTAFSMQVGNRTCKQNAKQTTKHIFQTIECKSVQLALTHQLKHLNFKFDSFE